MVEFNDMEYRYLGNTGLLVSVLGFGNWYTKEVPDFQEKLNDLVKKAL